MPLLALWQTGTNSIKYFFFYHFSVCFGSLMIKISRGITLSVEWGESVENDEEIRGCGGVRMKTQHKQRRRRIRKSCSIVAILHFYLFVLIRAPFVCLVSNFHFQFYIYQNESKTQTNKQNIYNM